MSDTTPPPDGRAPQPPQPPQPPAYPQAPSAYPPPASATQPAPTPPPYGQQPSQPGGYPPPAYGTPQQQYAAAPAYGSAYGSAKTNTLAVVSLIASIVGLVFVPFIGSIVGVITGHMSLSQIKQTGEQGRGMGLTGTILGWVGLAFSILGLILLFAFIPYMMTTIPTTT
ncbi:hypothetical protein GCM10022200_03020 [Microbacterium awajiense]|uniref:DUF4190 domain-containing protein n=1 Tax=Microbacterium awajiense TaxID=415214 RepID=A0ABP7A3A8_9MICO